MHYLPYTGRSTPILKNMYPPSPIALLGGETMSGGKDYIFWGVLGNIGTHYGSVHTGFNLSFIGVSHSASPQLLWTL